MKHVSKCNDWIYSETPFPAYKAELVFGRNKRDKSFIPCNVQPIEMLVERHVFGICQKQKEYILPENQFRIIKTKEKGTIMIVPGEDTTNRCLAMIGISDGFRGGSGIKKEATTATILKECAAGAACNGRYTCIALLDFGQRVVLWSNGRRNNDVISYFWNGNELVENKYTKAEWDFLYISANDSEVTPL